MQPPTPTSKTCASESEQSTPTSNESEDLDKKDLDKKDFGRREDEQPEDDLFSALDGETLADLLALHSSTLAGLVAWYELR
jgi:hypothetical protein